VIVEHGEAGRFNLTRVRLKRSPIRPHTSTFAGFNLTRVRLKPVAHCLSPPKNRLQPHESSSETRSTRRCSITSHCFNLTRVRLKQSRPFRGVEQLPASTSREFV